MTRGVIGCKVFTDTEKYASEDSELAAACVNALPALLRQMLGFCSFKPRTLFTDRGPGFYHSIHGTVTGEYHLACQKHHFKLWAGTNAKKGDRAQPGDISDVLLHETAISWVKERIAKSNAAVREPWNETPQQFAARLQQVIKDVNKSCNLDGLCREFPARLQELKRRGGDRLPT